jgi:hypothetical protein
MEGHRWNPLFPEHSESRGAVNVDASNCPFGQAWRTGKLLAFTVAWLRGNSLHLKFIG